MTIPLVPLLVGILVFVIIGVIIRVAVESIPLTARIGQLLYLVLVLVFIVWLIGLLFGYGPVVLR